MPRQLVAILWAVWIAARIALVLAILAVTLLVLAGLWDALVSGSL